jgi:signal transduction histidine kinase
MVAKEIVTASHLSSAAAVLQRPGGETDGAGMPQWSRALLRAVTHELRSPLTVIRAYSSVVMQRKTRLTHGEVKDIMRRIDRSARLVEVIVGDLETLVRHEAVTMRPVMLDLGSFLADHADDLQALAPGRELRLEFHPGSLHLYADPQRLRQVLNNLVENAHKYSRPGGGITIRVGCARDSVLIAVQDEGPGVPPDEIEQVFEPFYRGSHGTEADGSGLGLAICKSLVEAQGGGLRAAPSPCGGFQMLVTLPAAA